jgi:hypothetical protein
MVEAVPDLRSRRRQGHADTPVLLERFDNYDLSGESICLLNRLASTRK